MTSNSKIAAVHALKSRPPIRLILLLAAATIVLIAWPILPHATIILPAHWNFDLRTLLPSQFQLSSSDGAEQGTGASSEPASKLAAAPANPSTPANPAAPASASAPASFAANVPLTAVAPLDELKLMDRASDLLLEQIARDPHDASLHNRVALMFASSGDFNSATIHFEKAIDLSRASIGALKQREREARAKGENEQASLLLEDISKLNVELSAAHSSLARVYDLIGKHDRVVAQLDQLNSDIVFGADLQKKEMPAPTQVAEDESNHQMDTRALRSLARAQALMQAHRVPEAIQEYKNLVAIDPQSAEPHEKLGVAALLIGDGATAIQEFEAAIRLAPDNAATHNSLGLAYQARGEIDRAQSEFEKSVALNGKGADAAFNLGSILAERGQYGQAIDAFRTAVRNNPRATMAHNHLGSLLSLQGNYREAIPEFQQALALAPDLASSHYGLGVCLYNCKDYPASIREFKRALVLNPNLVDAHNKIDLAYRKSGLATIGAGRIN